MVHLLLGIIYLSFISLGLPDALLGAAWPMMCQEFSVPVSYAGGISLIIAMGTVVSSLQSDRLTKWLGTGKVTAFSVAMTAVALWGFSVSTEFWQLCLWGIPYGLGAGSVDAALNNYVAIHYASRHMSWLHFMWGLGASVGPYIMGLALTGGMGWNMGYGIIALIQIVLTGVIFLSVPMWKKRRDTETETGEKPKPLTMKQIFAIPGAKEVLIAFFCYCGLEQTCILWGSSYFVMHIGLQEELAASLASLYMIGLTVGRFLSGFLTYKFNDENMIRLGEGIIVLGAVVMLLPLGQAAPMVGLTLMGLGSAPVYPCVIHSTPAHFGEDNSQAIIGVQMASAYVGICVMPPLFGLIANHISAGLLPWYVGAINLLMIAMSEKLNRKCAGR
ncbi:MAG: MFS transporter [Oscillospiraceae bacterium]|nr:MFS transporter [Oscillospiraceae bacterium]